MLNDVGQFRSRLGKKFLKTPIYYSEHIEYSLDNPAESFSPKLQKFSLQVKN